MKSTFLPIKIVLLLSVFLSSWPSSAKNLNKFYIKGVVKSFSGEKSNADSSSYGVGGIKVFYKESDSAYSNTKGEFELIIETSENFIEIQLDKNSLPAGSVIVGPATYQFYKDVHHLNEVEFRVKLNQQHQKSHFYKEHKAVVLNSHLTKYQMDFKQMNNFIYINDVKWKAIESGQKLFEKETLADTEVSYDLKLLKFATKWISSKEFIEAQFNNLKQVTLNIAYKKEDLINDKQLDLIKERIESELKLVKDFLEVQFTPADANKIKFDLKYKQNTCEVDKKSLSKGLSYYIDLSSDKQIIFDCDEYEIAFHAPKLSIKDGHYDVGHNAYHIKRIGSEHLVLKLDELVRIDLPPVDIEKVEDGQFMISFSQYLEEMRDDRVFFVLNHDNLKELRVNHKKLDLSEDNIGFIDKAKAGSNEINVKGIANDGKVVEKKLTYTLYPKDKLSLNINTGLRNRSYLTDTFEAEYSINEVYFIDAKSKFFLDRKWGFFFSYFRDTSMIELSTLDGQIAEITHGELDLAAVYRKSLSPQLYHSNEITMYAGMKQISIDKTLENLEQPFPGDYSGPLIGAEYKVYDFLFSNIISESRAFISFNLSNTEEYLLDLEQEFFINLNKLGKFLPFTRSFYTYDYQYSYIRQFDLVLGFSSQFIDREVDNFKDGTISEVNTGFYTGINFRY